MSVDSPNRQKPGVAPFDGVRILDFTQVLAGPYCTQQMALLGADIIKVENRRGGDQSRHSLPATDPEVAALGFSPLFLSVNTGKRSLTLDLKHPRAGEVVRRLAADADVVIENFKAGTMERMGFGYQALKETNPKLVYCSISGYGQSGPRASAAAYDATIQAASGMMAVTGTPETGPIKTGYWTIDMATAMQASFAIAATLYSRERTGHGDYLDLSMLDTAIGIMAPNLAIYAINRENPTPAGNRSQTGNPTADVFPTRDGFLMLAAATQGQFLSLAKVLGREDLPADPRFKTLADRIAHADAMRTLLADAFTLQTSEVWEIRLAEAGIPASRISTVPQVLNGNNQLAHRSTIRTVARQAEAGEGSWSYVNVPFHATHAEQGAPRPSPLLGEHTDEILAEAGFSTTEIAELRRDGAV